MTTTHEPLPADPPGLRLGPLTAWLAAQGLPIDADAPLRATLLEGGRSNVTYLLEDASGGRLVLRRPPLGHVMPSAHDMRREYQVLSGLNRVGFPAPRALAESQDESVIGSTFMVMSYVDGRVISDEESARDLPAAEASDVCAALIDTLAHLHAVDAEAAGLGDLGRPQGYLTRQVRRWGQQWEITKTRDLPAIDSLRSWLESQVETIPADLPWSIVHGDYRLDNVILGRASSEVLAVLDWEMSTLGDPVSDLAVALVYWSEAADGLRNRVPVSEHITDGPGFWTREQLIERYAGTTESPLDHLDFATVLACFKLAVIMESIHYRNLSGQQLGTAAASGGQMGIATEALAEMGLAVMSQGTIRGLSA
jgi:aminoglycoside phosphotransferase (APT) family kinase protein